MPYCNIINHGNETRNRRWDPTRLKDVIYNVLCYRNLNTNSDPHKKSFWYKKYLK